MIYMTIQLIIFAVFIVVGVMHNRSKKSLGITHLTTLKYLHSMAWLSGALALNTFGYFLLIVSQIH